MRFFSNNLSPSPKSRTSGEPQPGCTWHNRLLVNRDHHNQIDLLADQVLDAAEFRFGRTTAHRLPPSSNFGTEITENILHMKYTVK
jgi:hypothetical protein